MEKAKKPRLLILLSRVPYPLDKGDKLRAFKQIEGLSQDFRIILVCLHIGFLNPKAFDELNPLCENVHVIYLSKWRIFWRLVRNTWKHTPFQVAYFYSKQAQKEFDLIVEKYLPQKFFFQLLRVAEYAMKYTIYDKTLDYMDALSLGMERRAKKAPFYLKPLFYEEAKRLKLYEQEIYQHFNKKLIISMRDKTHIAQQSSLDIKVVPNGIDDSYFSTPTFEKTHDICFTGNMSYPPNISAAQFLVRDILPLLKNSENLQVIIAGKSPKKGVKRLANKNVEVTGWVDDMRLSYSKSKIFVAPMKIGSGLQNKLLEAMAVGIPCITTPLANDALGATNGSQIIIADTAEQFAQAIEDLLQNEAKRLKIGKAGQAFVKENYSWKVWNSSLNDLIAS